GLLAGACVAAGWAHGSPGGRAGAHEASASRAAQVYHGPVVNRVTPRAFAWGRDNMPGVMPPRHTHGPTRSDAGAAQVASGSNGGFSPIPSGRWPRRLRGRWLSPLRSPSEESIASTTLRRTIS